MKSLKSNFHVICEKPFLTKKKNLNKIIKIEKNKNKHLFECFMYAYHPVFKYLKNLINSKKFGKIRYVISNFRFPSLPKKDNRYKKHLGNGFFNDAASYLVSLESYLFENFNLNFKFESKILKKKIDLRGYFFLKTTINRDIISEGANYRITLKFFLMKQLYILTNFLVKLKESQFFAASFKI